MFKVLEKKMTKKDAERYVKEHPKWRMPSLKEITKINVCGHIDAPQSCSKTSPAFANGKQIDLSLLVKTRVVLVPRLKNVKTGTVFYVGMTDRISKLGYISGKAYHKSQISNLDEISSAMLNGDIVFFQEEN